MESVKAKAGQPKGRGGVEGGHRFREENKVWEMAADWVCQDSFRREVSDSPTVPVEDF